ncbi:protein phosphatase PTC7 homolog fig [Drosophila novamexicana]|uniref:protein phosphatase PTC7 homolog fig n=1 Tax=Drosophila novamexicana TaxID=47314 RepID=UPI0011E5FFAA|nr:protein phosphatase PTC7 homolog fig [Drosophila novamexicana]
MPDSKSRNSKFLFEIRFEKHSFLLIKFRPQNYKMFFTVRNLSNRTSQVLNCAFAQCRLLSSIASAKGVPRLIKAIQGSSKEPLTDLQLRLIEDNRFGEDSWFVSSTPKAETMGVADGVGGWRKLGIDAGVFARELMSHCSEIAEQAEYDGLNPRQLLIDSYDRLKNKRPCNVCGSSTACLVTLHRPDCTLHSANLGDSGFLVLRNGRVLHRSDEQLHCFNTPYQLTVPPHPAMDCVLRDSPEQAVSTHLPLQPGDLVLLATDGLFDNVPESMLINQLRALQGETRAEYLQQAANRLVELAKTLSVSPTFQSPFALKARANNVDYGIGGKPDDITVILASLEVPDKQ